MRFPFPNRWLQRADMKKGTLQDARNQDESSEPLVKQLDKTTSTHPTHPDFSVYFAQQQAGADFWCAAIEVAVVVFFALMQFQGLDGWFLYVSRSLLLLGVLLPCLVPGLWAVTRHRILAADRIATVAGNLLLLVLLPDSEVGECRRRLKREQLLLVVLLGLEQKRVDIFCALLHKRISWCQFCVLLVLLIIQCACSRHDTFLHVLHLHLGNLSQEIAAVQFALCAQSANIVLPYVCIYTPCHGADLPSLCTDIILPLLFLCDSLCASHLRPGVTQSTMWHALSH